MPTNVHFSMFGYHFNVSCDDGELVDRVTKDFFIYVTEANHAGVVISIESKLEEADRGKGNIFFQDGVVVNMNHETKDALIYHHDIDRLHEITYLYLLSVLGKKLDLKGMHRIHASAVAINGSEAALFVGASGMGKSHLAYLLPYETLSDDTPFISAAGVYPMLSRRGFLPEHQIKSEKFYQLNRLRHGQKLLLPIIKKAKHECYPLKSIYFLRDGQSNGIRRAWGIEKLYYFSKYLVVGHGTPQIAKFFLEPGFRDFFRKSLILLSRLKLMIALVLKARCYILDSDKSFETIKYVSHHFEKVPNN